MARKNIQSALHEERLFPPSALFRSRAGLKAGELTAMYAKAERDYVGWVGELLSPIAKPDEIRLTDNLPKTRSGKIMHGLLRAIARGEDFTQDMSTLENPAILELLRCGGAAPPAGNGKRGTQRKRAAAAKSVNARVKSVHRPRGKS
ncbi:MAG: hypothetical protein NVS1B6_02780 [Steroidobacteraceae bacterium]